MPAAHHHLDDETLNAVLDGEATDTQRADASRCPRCTARLARLGQVSTALGAPVSPSDPDRRRAALDAALAAHDAGIGIAAPPSLELRRHRRMSPGWAAAAAVVLAGALAVPLVDGLGGNDQDREAATTGDRDTSAGGSVTEEDALADQDAMPEASAARPHLGEIDLAGLDELAATIVRDGPRYLSSDPAPATGRTEADAAALEQSCEPAARRRDPSLQWLVYAGEGTVAGRPAVVLGFEVATAGAPPSVRVLVLASDDCTELGSAAA